MPLATSSHRAQVGSLRFRQCYLDLTSIQYRTEVTLTATWVRCRRCRFADAQRSGDRHAASAHGSRVGVRRSVVCGSDVKREPGRLPESQGHAK